MLSNVTQTRVTKGAFLVCCKGTHLINSGKASPSPRQRGWRTWRRTCWKLPGPDGQTGLGSMPKRRRLQAVWKEHAVQCSNKETSSLSPPPPPVTSGRNCTLARFIHIPHINFAWSCLSWCITNNNVYSLWQIAGGENCKSSASFKYNMIHMFCLQRAGYSGSACLRSHPKAYASLW